MQLGGIGLNRESYAGKIAVYGMLTALAMIFSFIETLIPLSIGIPGVKLGLANLVTIVCLYIMGPIGAITVSFLRILLVGLTFGNASMLMFSAAGGALSLICMILARKSGLLSTAGVSMIGGVMHNVGQLAVASRVVKTAGVFAYLPVLTAAGVITGIVIGIVAAAVIKRLKPLIVKKEL